MPFFVICISLLCLLHIAAPEGRTQSIAITPHSLPPTVRAQLTSDDAFIIGGPIAYGLTPEIKNAHYKLGPSGKTFLALAALKMVEAGKIDMNEPIAKLLPETLEYSPFVVSVTLQHILTETAGYAVPVITNQSTPLEYYARGMRTPGHMSHNDPVGWAILIKLLENVNGTNLQTIFKEYIEQPLGLPDGSIKTNDSAIMPSPLLAAQEITATGETIAAVLRLLVRNRTPNGSLFLQKYTHDFIIHNHGWRMHPLTQAKTLAGKRLTQNGRIWLEPSYSLCSDGVFFMAYPEAETVFVKLNCPSLAYEDAVKNIVEERFLPATKDTRLKEALRLSRPLKKIGGSYLKTDAPSGALQNRLRIIQYESIYVSEKKDGSLTVESGTHTKTFSYVAPFHYKSYDDITLTLSPYQQGGYLILDGTAYRYAGPFAKKRYLIHSVPFIIIILFSSLFYIRKDQSKKWQRMGQYGVIGTTLILVSVAIDYYFWSTVLFKWHLPWLINIWRFFMNAGLALILTLPMFMLSFIKNPGDIKGLRVIFIPLHLGLLSIAAIALLFILVVWGIGGEFSAF